MVIKMVSAPRDGWKRNANAIWRCSGFAAGWRLIMLSYNIKRTLNILTFDDLIQKLKNWKSKYRKA